MQFERFWSKVNKNGPNGCWEWTACIHHSGYGHFYWEGRVWSTHRLSYTWTKGEIPAGFEIHHECNNKLCVNPDHLRCLTKGEHTVIGASQSTINRKKTHCPKGHLYSGS